MNEEFIKRHADVVDWDNVVSRIKPDDYSHEFYHRFHREINKNILYESGNMTTEFAHKNAENIGGHRWYKNGMLHRENGPAIQRFDGSFAFMLDNKYHRDNGQPAVVYIDDGKTVREEWWFNGERHRANGPAVTTKFGEEQWYWKGQFHRDDGPAITNYEGVKCWYKHGVRHRDGGPAIVYPNGDELWFINGRELPIEEVAKIMIGSLETK